MQTKTKTKARLLPVRTDLRSLKRRTELPGKRCGDKKRYEKKNKSTSGSFGFLDIEFETIHLLDLKPEKDYDKLLKLLELNFGKSPVKESLGMDLRWHYINLCEIVKDTETDFHIEDLGGGDFSLVIYHVMNPMGEWLTPRLNFLPKLKRRAESLFNTVINSLRILSHEFGIYRFDQTIWVGEWTEEQIMELLDSGEPEDYKRAQELLRLVHKYNEGIAAKYFGMVRENPTISVDECIKKLNRFPEDLKPIAEALVKCLELSKTGEKLTDYEPIAVEGFSFDYSEEGLLLGEQYAWAWEYDDFFAVAEEHVDGMAGINIMAPFNWITFKGDQQLIKLENLKTELRKLFDASEISFPAKFENCMTRLSYAIGDVYPSKQK